MDLKERFTSQVVNELNTTVKNQMKEVADICPVQFVINGSHFIERIEQRAIPKGQLGSLFRKLFEEKYCELLWFFHNNRKNYDFGDKHISCVYKDVKVIFRAVDDKMTTPSRFALVPTTVLLSNYPSVHDYEIVLE